MMIAQHCKYSYCPLDCAFLKGYNGKFVFYIYIYVCMYIYVYIYHYFKKIKSQFQKKEREREIKRFPDRQMMRKFVTRRPDLQEMLKAVVCAEMNGC